MKVLIILAALSLMPFASHANDACAADREKLCAGVEHGEGRIAKCMRENSDKLSTECKAQRETMKDARKELKEACEDDVEKFCGSVKAGGGRIIKCMKQNIDKVSAGCKAEVEQLKELRKKKRK